MEKQRAKDSYDSPEEGHGGRAVLGDRAEFGNSLEHAYLGAGKSGGHVSSVDKRKNQSFQQDKSGPFTPHVKTISNELRAYMNKAKLCNFR